MNIILGTLGYFAVIAVAGFVICEGLGWLLDWAFNVEEGSF